MSDYAKEWIITEEHKQQMSSFMTDFWKVIKASYEIPADTNPAHDHYWKTLIQWCDALMKKYNGDPVVCRIVVGYVEAQSDKATRRPVQQMSISDYYKEQRMNELLGN